MKYFILFIIGYLFSFGLYIFSNSIYRYYKKVKLMTNFFGITAIIQIVIIIILKLLPFPDNYTELFNILFKYIFLFSFILYASCLLSLHKIKKHTKVNLTFDSMINNNEFSKLLSKDIFNYLTGNKTAFVQRLMFNISCKVDNTFHFISANNNVIYIEIDDKILIIKLDICSKYFNFKEGLNILDYLLLKIRPINVNIKISDIFFEYKNKFFKYDVYFNNLKFEENFNSDKVKMLDIIYY